MFSSLLWGPLCSWFSGSGLPDCGIRKFWSFAQSDVLGCGSTVSWISSIEVGVRRGFRRDNVSVGFSPSIFGLFLTLSSEASGFPARKTVHPKPLLNSEP